MRRWQFRSYVEKQQDVILTWYGRQPEAVQAEFVSIAQYLRDEPLEAWEGHDFKSLQGNLAELGEMRVIVVGMHNRIFGFHDEQGLEFTMLLAARKTKKFSYQVSGSTALKRMARVRSSRDIYSVKADWIFE